MARVIKYVPDVFKEKTQEGAEHWKFQGHIEIEMPTLDQIEEIAAEAGLYDIDEKQLPGTKNGFYMKLLLKAYRLGRERFVKGAEIVRTSDGRKFGLEDLDYIPELSKLALELGTRFCKGFDLGNEQEPQSASN